MKGTIAVVATRVPSSVITIISLLLDINLTFWYNLDGMAPAMCIYSHPNLNYRDIYHHKGDLKFPAP